MKRPKLQMPPAATAFLKWLQRNTIKLTLAIALLALLFAPIPATWVLGALIGILLMIVVASAWIGATLGAIIGFLDWGSRTFLAYGREIATMIAWVKRILSRKATADAGANTDAAADTDFSSAAE